MNLMYTIVVKPFVCVGAAARSSREGGVVIRRFECMN